MLFDVMRPLHRAATRGPLRFVRGPVLGLSLTLGIWGGASQALAGPAKPAAEQTKQAEAVDLAELGEESEATPPRAPKRARRFDKDDDVIDPRKRDLPRRHRFRLGLASSYMRLSAALDNSTGETVRFHHAPLMLDLAYQLQFLKYMMMRVGMAAGYNVANTRYSMPLALSPRLMVGYQGPGLGIAAGYVYMGVAHPFATLLNGADGRPNSVGGPITFANHGVVGELSFTSRIDDVALYFALGAGATRTRLAHFDLAVDSWRFSMHFGAGVYFDGSRRRRKRAEAKQ